MSKVLRKVRGFVADESGVAITEYLVLLGILTVALIAAVGLFGGALQTAWAAWTTWVTTNLAGPS